MTQYSTLYEKCLSKLEDPTLAMLPEEDLEEMLHGYLMSAIAKHRKCEHNLSDRDEELKQFNSDLSDLEIEILSILMVREWISVQLHSVVNTLQVFGGKEEKLGFISSVRCIGKPCSVFLRICWNTLRVVIPKRRDEICSNGNGLKSLQIGQSAGKMRIVSPSTTVG